MKDLPADKADPLVPALHRIRSYVLRAGRMSEAQKKAYEALHERFCIPYQNKNIEFEEIFATKRAPVIEIGFGMGQASALIARENPQIPYLGLEVHKPGVGRLLWEIENKNLKNIRIIEHDAVEVLEHMIPDNSVAAFHVFFPDPWPKKKHHKRRLITRPFTNLLASKVSANGYIYMASDWEDYGFWALEELTATEGLVNAYKDFAPRQEWRPETKFERKGLAKEHKVYELYFIKTP